MAGCMEARMGAWMGAGMEAWMEGWKDGWMDGWIDRGEKYRTAIPSGVVEAKRNR